MQRKKTIKITILEKDQQDIVATGLNTLNPEQNSIQVSDSDSDRTKKRKKVEQLKEEREKLEAKLEE